MFDDSIDPSYIHIRTSSDQTTVVNYESSTGTSIIDNVSIQPNLSVSAVLGTILQDIEGVD